MEFRFHNKEVSFEEALSFFNLDKNKFMTITREQARKEISSLVNKKLKEIKTFNEFVEFVKSMELMPCGQYDLYSKRRGYYIYDFERDSNDMDTVNYLYSDNRSVGKSQIKNLHRFFNCEGR